MQLITSKAAGGQCPELLNPTRMRNPLYAVQDVPETDRQLNKTLLIRE
jgi:hypothetical protein